MLSQCKNRRELINRVNQRKGGGGEAERIGEEDRHRPRKATPQADRIGDTEAGGERERRAEGARGAVGGATPRGAETDRATPERPDITACYQNANIE